MDLDPLLAGIMRGLDKTVEFLIDGTYISVVEKLVNSYLRYLDLETQKIWLQEEGKRFPVFLVGEAEGSRGKRGKRGK
jgi:hypothetical protein